MAQNDGLLYPKVAHNPLKINLNYGPLAFRVIPYGPLECARHGFGLDILNSTMMEVLLSSTDLVDSYYLDPKSMQHNGLLGYG